MIVHRLIPKLTKISRHMMKMKNINKYAQKENWAEITYLPSVPGLILIC